MKLQLRALQTLRQSRSKGAPAGWERILFSLLRANQSKPEAQRVEKILGLLVSAQAHLTEQHRLLDSNGDAAGIPAFLDLHQRGKQSERAYYIALEQLETELSRYRWRSSISGGLNGFGETLEWDTKVKTGNTVWEYAIIRLLLDCIKEPGVLSRFRRCSDCHNWFYAATSHQRFCRVACRRRYTSRSSEFKEKRRIYMTQVYRPQQKERDLRSFSAAQATRRPKEQRGK